MWKTSSPEVILTVTIIFCIIVPICFSKELPIAAQPIPPESIHAAQFPNISNFTDSSFVSSALSSRKKYATAPPTSTYLEDTHVQREIHNLTDIVPFLVDNVIRPIITRILVNQNVYTYLNGAPSSTETPPDAVHPVLAPQKTETTSNTSNNDASIATASSSSSKITEKVVSTVDQNGNSVRNLFEEKGGDSTISPGKTKYKVRPRGRPSTSTTPASYIPDEDDEDDSGVFNKIKHL